MSQRAGLTDHLLLPDVNQFVLAAGEILLRVELAETFCELSRSGRRRVEAGSDVVGAGELAVGKVGGVAGADAAPGNR
jgi:hypothetical protein